MRHLRANEALEPLDRPVGLVMAAINFFLLGAGLVRSIPELGRYLKMKRM